MACPAVRVWRLPALPYGGRDSVETRIVTDPAAVGVLEDRAKEASRTVELLLA